MKITNEQIEEARILIALRGGEAYRGVFLDKEQDFPRPIEVQRALCREVAGVLLPSCDNINIELSSIRGRAELRMRGIASEDREDARAAMTRALPFITAYYPVVVE